MSISRRARARVQCDSFSRCSALDPDSPPPRRRPFGSRTSHRAVLPRLGSASRSHAIRPVLSFGRRHSFRRSRRARTPPPLDFSFRSAQLVGWVFRARVGAARRRPRSIRPMSAAHGCCFQRRGPKSRQTPHRRFPRDAGALGFTPSPLTSVSRPIPLERCLLQPLICQRPSDAPSPAGSPGGAMSTGVGPRSLARSQVEKPESLGPLHQAA